MQIVVGLGNPGAEYRGTRHNIGEEVVGRVVERADGTFSRGPSRVRALTFKTGTGDETAMFAIPTTFMNQSGAAVRPLLEYFKVDAEDLLVVHDDIDLEFGRLRLQVGGGSGGHNGVRSIEQHLGTNGFSRLKAGVGRPPGSIEPADHVLRSFSQSERPEVERIVEDAADVVERWLSDRQRAQEQAAHRGRDG